MFRAGDIVAGRYRLCAIVGEGGMGTVFDAVNTWTERRVALKMLRPREAAEERALRRFLREGKLASRLEHRNIVNVIDMGQDEDGAVFIVQELLRGRTLRAALIEPVAIEAAIAVTLAMLDALAYAHERGLVHRDVKPDNIFLARDGERGAVTPKLIDFGIARALEPAPEDPSVTESGVALGTAHYMAPEQARSSNDADARSDLWSVGAVLFELVAGRPPFIGSNFNTVVAQLLTQRPPRVDQVQPSVAPAIADVVERALEPEPSARFSSAGAFREALIDAAREAGVSPSLDLWSATPLDDALRERAHDNVDPRRASYDEHRVTESIDRSADDERPMPARITDEIAMVSTANAQPSATRGRRRAPDALIVVVALVFAGVAGAALPLVRSARTVTAAAQTPPVPAAIVAPPRSAPTNTTAVQRTPTLEAIAPAARPSNAAAAGTATATARDVTRPPPRGRPLPSSAAPRVGPTRTGSQPVVAPSAPVRSPTITTTNNGAPLLPAE